MKTLLIMRHGKSSWSRPHLTDHDRPLKKRGRRDGPRMGELLMDEGLEPDVIVSSTAERARHTAELVAEAVGTGAAVRLIGELYHGDPEDYLSALATVEDDARIVLMVGHNPGVEMLVEHLTDVDERMPTAAVAHVDLPIESWRDVTVAASAKLRAIWRPRELP